MPTSDPGRESGSRSLPGARVRSSRLYALAVVVALAATSLALAFRNGAYSPVDWLPLMLAVALLAAVLCLSAPSAPRLARTQQILLGLFVLQAVWTAASMLWAGSVGNAWQEANRTLFYLLGMALVVAAVRWNGPKTLVWLAGGLVAVVGIVAVVIVFRLGLAADPLRYFAGGRLNYPVSYWNALAALLMIGFWLALGLANGAAAPGRGRAGGLPWWNQPLFLAVAVVLVELALLPQSRGALWAFFLVLPFFVILSPHRFRALVNLAIVVLPVIVFWVRINGVYVAIRDGTSTEAALSRGLRAVGFSILIVGVLWTVTRLAERALGPLSRRLTFWVGVALIVLTVLGAAGGLLYADQRTGGLGGYVQQRWTEFTSDKGTSDSAGSRFNEVSLNGRLTQWKVAGRAFTEHPVLGIGAQNFEFYWYEHRPTTLQVLLPHSQPMQLLSELGIVGPVLWVAFVIWALVRGGILRFRAGRRTNQAVMAAMLTAVLSWFVHSSADWLWQLAGASLPALLLLGALVAAGPPVMPRATAKVEAKRRPRWHVGVRVAATVVAVLVLVSAALPYLSLRYVDLAIANADSNAAAAVGSARTAASLDLFSPAPFVAEAVVFTSAAQSSGAGGTSSSGAGARRDDLALAVAAWQAAGKREPLSWLIAYKTSLAVLAYRDAGLAAPAGPSASGGSSPLSGADPGLWVGTETLRSRSNQELTQVARTYLAEAKRLNPLSTEVAETLKKLDSGAG